MKHIQHIYNKDLVNTGNWTQPAQHNRHSLWKWKAVRKNCSESKL